MPHRTGGHVAKRKGGKTDLAARCAMVPVRMHGSAGIGWARQELESLSALAGAGVLERSAGKGDVMANLWLARAAHEFSGAAAASTTLSAEEKQEYLAFAGRSLLPLCKRLIHALVSEQGMDGVWMDDSGLLAGLAVKGKPNAALALPLRLNALWYTALESTGMALRGLTPMGAAAGYGPGKKDPSGDHFERLSGRFRRAFTKAYWCETHQRICPPAPCVPPAARGGAEAAKTVKPGVKPEPAVDSRDSEHGGIPDGEQLLLMILPVSPIPRTKQLGALKQIAEQASGPLGVYVNLADGTRAESLLHRAWMAQALAVDATNDTQRQQAAAAARPLETLRETASSTGVAGLYRDGKPLTADVDPLVTAEVLGTLERILGA